MTKSMIIVYLVAKIECHERLYALLPWTNIASVHPQNVFSQCQAGVEEQKPSLTKCMFHIKYQKIYIYKSSKSGLKNLIREIPGTAEREKLACIHPKSKTLE